jgi:ABC-2 type transport system ATP-binding protein
VVVKTSDPQPILQDFGDMCSKSEQGDLLIRMKSPDDKQEVMKHLVENYDIDRVSVFEPSLNDIFVEYAGDSK